MFTLSQCTRNIALNLEGTLNLLLQALHLKLNQEINETGHERIDEEHANEGHNGNWAGAIIIS